MTTKSHPFLSESLKALKAHIKASQAGCLLASAHVELVGVSKTVPENRIKEALALGLTHFGENRVQEALAKWPPLKILYPDTKLHLIGPLQTNKVKEALSVFDIIETVDREKLVDAIAKEVVGHESRVIDNTHDQGPMTHAYFIQVNTGAESQKGGVLPKEADALIAYAKQKNLNITGLMCIPPQGENPGPHFALLREIAKRNHLPNLSMGMSNDFETAIRFGATHVRIGTALFGERA